MPFKVNILIFKMSLDEEAGLIQQLKNISVHPHTVYHQKGLLKLFCTVQT